MNFLGIGYLLVCIALVWGGAFVFLNLLMGLYDQRRARLTNFFSTQELEVHRERVDTYNQRQRRKLSAIGAAGITIIYLLWSSLAPAPFTAPLHYAFPHCF